MTSIETTIGPGEMVIWESIITNVGGGYQPTTGEFTCPQDGLYYFAVSVTSHATEGKRAHLHIMHNGNAVVTTLAYANPAFDSSTVSAVMECTNGQKVWVQCKAGVTCSVLGYTQEKYSSFSGFLIV